MKTFIKLSGAIQLTILLSIAVVGQSTVIVSSSFSENEFKGAPFSAKSVVEYTQTLSDGNRIISRREKLLFRDSQGRFRVEEIKHAKKSRNARFPKTSEITITDPVAGFKYYLNPEKKIARRVKIKDLAIVGRVVLNTYADSNNKTEDLGVSTIEGVKTKGFRSTTVNPAGTIGNEKDLVGVFESWFSDELKQVILQTRTNPRAGVYRYELKDIKRSEPDKTLFAVPSEYKIVDGKKTTITSGSVYVHGTIKSN